MEIPQNKSQLPRILHQLLIFFTLAMLAVLAGFNISDTILHSGRLGGE